MFVSYDGMEYNMAANGKDNTMRDKRITKVAVNPAVTEEVWAATEEGVFATRDGGASWDEMNRGLDTTDVFTLTFSGDGTLYAGTRGYGVYRFEGSEQLWQQTEPLSNFGVFWSSWDRPLT